MTTYKEIFGKPIKVVSSDPTDAGAEGQVWYNETTGKFRSVVAAGAWASAATTINLSKSGAGAGTTTAGLVFGGRNPPGPAFVSTTEEYNGSGWTAGGALNTARSYLAGFGTQTGGVAAGGRINAPGSSTNATEEYNGTAWTTVNNMGTGRRVGGSAGIVQTAGLAFGGGPPAVTSNEEYDGTNWTAGGALSTGRYYLAGFGTLTSAVATGGNTGPGPASGGVTEEYNGSSWTAGGAPNSARSEFGAAGSSATAGMIFGGQTAPGDVALMEEYNGTSFSEGADLATARAGINGGGNSVTSTFAAQGNPTLNLTEEYNFTANTITAAAWSSGGALPQGVSYNSGAGTQTASLSIGGQQPSTAAIANTYEYDGSSWSEGGPIASFFGSYPTPTSSYYFAACGTQTAAVIVGGAETNNRTVEYNGSSWTQTGNYPSQIAQSTMNGIQTAAINISGSGPPPGYTGVVANYNGSSWTASPVAFSPAGRRMSSAGTYTATIVSGGSNTGTITSAQEWDGSSWTTVGAPNSPQVDAKSTGIQTAALKMHGTSTESYNGSSWVTAASMANNRSLCTGGSSNDAGNTSAVVFGGSTPSFTSATEEFNGETTATNIVDITTS